MHNLFKRILQTKKIPEKWKGKMHNSTFIPIPFFPFTGVPSTPVPQYPPEQYPLFKRADKADPENYKGISVLNSVTKLFTKIIAEEMGLTGISEEQQGFR